MRDVWPESLDPATTLWRYFKTERFVSTLASSTLHFSAATQFTDRFEGAVKVLPPSAPPLRRESERAYFQHAFSELRRLTKVSCWHRASHESDAMWKLYAANHRGVAIRTNPTRLAAAVKSFRLAPSYDIETLWCGEVRYVDLVSGKAPHDMLKRFFCKHMPFAWEQEYRLAISLRMAEEFGVSIPAEGISVEVDLQVLIEAIVLGPSLEPAEVQAIEQAAEAGDLSGKLVTSSLLGTPLYL